MKKPMLVAAVIAAGVATGEGFGVKSPDGTLEAKIDVGEKLVYSIEKSGQTIIAPSTLGFLYKGREALNANWKVVSSEEKSANEAWKCVVKNRHSEVDIAYNELTLDLGEVKAVFRAMDDAIAFRFILPAGELASEETCFNVPYTARAWVAQYARDYTSS